MNYLIAFFGGIITFISPCILPLVPVYIAYISGITIKDLKNQDFKIKNLLINSVLFVLGFSIVFSILAIIFFIVFQSLGIYKIWLNRFAGILLIIFGFHIMEIINLPFLNSEIKYKNEIKRTNYFSSFLIGIIFGAGWTPCVGPILSSILFISANSNTLIRSISLLITYSLGLGLPFILTGLLINKFLEFSSKIKKSYKIIEIISGILLIIIGILLIFDWINYISNIITILFPKLSDIENKIFK